MLSVSTFLHRVERANAVNVAGNMAIQFIAITPEGEVMTQIILTFV
jgi:hypothetical protein